jgi:allophanate hydrolase subunit 1
MYRVQMLGFPGFAYLAGLDPRIATPRRPTPRARSAGSVAIGGELTGVYPLDLPGGWHLIGRSPCDSSIQPRAASLLSRETVCVSWPSPDSMRIQQGATWR